METQTEILKKEIKHLLEDRKTLSRKDLYQILLTNYPSLKIGTYDWLLYKFKKDRDIQNISRGIIALYNKPIYAPVLSDEIKRIYNAVNKRYELDSFLIWDTKWLNEFMIHQPFRSMTVLELDHDSIEDVFFFLRDNGYKDVFHRIGQKQNFNELLNTYISESHHPIVVQSSIGRSPTLEVNEVAVPKIEKILVDLVCDRALFDRFQGMELDRIISFAFMKYNISQSQFKNYAARRGKKTVALEYLAKHLKEDVIK